MKQRIRKIVSASLIIVMALIAVLPTFALAVAEEEENPVPVAYQYSISAGSKEWCGHCNDSYWEADGREVKWFTSITSVVVRKIKAMLYQYRYSVIIPDILLSSQDLTGSGGDYVEYIFTPSSTASYYTKVTTTESAGVSGRTNMFYS